MISYYRLLLAYYLKVILRVSTYAQHVTKWENKHILYYIYRHILPGAPMIWSIKDIKESEKEGQRDRIVILLLFHLWRISHFVF